MATIRNLEDIKKELNNRMEENKAKLDAWKKVEIVTKKDGKPFANFGKNFKNAKYTSESYALQGGENALIVYTRINGNGKCIGDEIKCYEFVDNLKDGRKEKTQNYMPEVTYLRQIYKFDMEDIKQAMEERKTYLENYIESLEKQLNEVEEIYNNVLQLHKQTMEYLKNSTKDNTRLSNHNDLYYMLSGIIENSCY